MCILMCMYDAALSLSLTLTHTYFRHLSPVSTNKLEAGKTERTNKETLKHKP